MLAGEAAIKAAVEARARREVAALERARKLIAGSSFGDEEREKVYRESFAVQDAMVRLEAKSAQWNQREYTVICDRCNGTKWVTDPSENR